MDVLEDRLDLAQLNFNDAVSYLRVFSSPNPQGYIWVRGSVQNGQFVAGHWERPRAGGTPVNTVAVVSPPLPPNITQPPVTGPLDAPLAPSEESFAFAKEQSFPAVASFDRTLVGAQGWDHLEKERLLADVDGDGRKDVVAFGLDGVWFAYSHGHSFAAPRFVLAQFGYNQGWTYTKHLRLMADVNGDRREDIVGFGGSGVWLSLSTGTEFAARTLALPNFGYDQGWRLEKHVRLMADVNGDRRQDIVGFYDSGVWLSLSTGTGFTAPRHVLPNYGYGQGWRVESHVRLLADVNGDRRADIVGFYNDGVWLSLSTGTGFTSPTFVLANFGVTQGWKDGHGNLPAYAIGRSTRMMADVNRDGRQDIVGFGDAGVGFALSTGTGFVMPTFKLPYLGTKWSGGIVYWRKRFVGDFNNDGYPDIVAYADDQGVVRSLTGPYGHGEVRKVLPLQGPSHRFNPLLDDFRFGDVDGDRMQDLVVFSTTDVYVARSSDAPPSQPISISRVRDVNGVVPLMTTEDADRILRDAGTILQTKDSANDVACPLGFTRAGAIATVDGPTNIDSKAELDQVFSLPGYVKVVDEINYCNGMNPAGGCAYRNRPSIIVDRYPPEQGYASILEGIIWAHEYGHTKGLPHRTDSLKAIMYPSAGKDHTEVNEGECNAIEQILNW